MAEYHSSSHKIFSVFFFNECFTETVSCNRNAILWIFLIIFFLEYIKATETVAKLSKKLLFGFCICGLSLKIPCVSFPL